MMRGKRIAGWVFAFACTVMAGCGFSLAGEGYGLYKNAVQTVSLEEKVNEIRSPGEFYFPGRDAGDLCAGCGSGGGSPLLQSISAWI